MLITLNPHSTFKEFFTEKEYKVEINSYYDIEFYLQGAHPRFKHYISKIKQGECQESFTYVTEDFKVKCGRNFLKIEVIQKEGKSPMTVMDYLNGNKIKIFSFS